MSNAHFLIPVVLAKFSLLFSVIWEFPTNGNEKGGDMTGAG